MKPLTLDQLRTTQHAGGVKSVTLKASGKEFGIEIKLKAGGDAVLVVKNTGKTRSFADPRRALMLLREMGIREASIDASQWTPDQGDLL